MEDPDAVLERRLYGAAAGYKPHAPDDLTRFIETVPAQFEGHRGWRLALHRGRALASGLALTAAAIVVAAVATSAIVSVRSTHTPGSSQHGGSGSTWTWLKADDSTPLLASLERVKNGWVAVCMDNTPGEPCTSPDGVHWTWPMDPAIVSLEDVPDYIGQVSPHEVTSHDGIYVASLWVPDGYYRSTDGVYWSRIDDSLLQNQNSFFGIADLAHGFAKLEWGSSAEDSYVLTSPDGLKWTKSGPLPSGAAGAGGGALAEAGPAGIYVPGLDPGVAWRTVDGTNWSRVDMGRFKLPMGVAAIPGGYVAEDPYSHTVIESSDGLSWHEYKADVSGYLWNLVVVGDRMLVDVYDTSAGSQTATADTAIWESFDWGKTWHVLLGPDGTQLKGIVQAYGNAVVISEANLDNHVVWVGYLGAHPVPSAAATVGPAAATPTPIPTRTPTPAAGAIMPQALRDEWTWRQTDGTYLEGAIAVPGGWFATCGTPRDQELADATLCSSTDGLHWTKPADPAIVRAHGSQPFWPVHAVRSGSVYVAFSLDKPIPFVGEGTPALWRSADGHNWTEISSPALDGLTLWSVDVLGGRFVTVGTAAGGGSLLTSSDGLEWVKRSDTPGDPNGGGRVAEFGVVLATGTNGLGGTWVSVDGSSWVRAQLPTGVTELGPSVRRADGSYIGIGYDFSGAVHDTLMTSTDGIRWTPAPTPTGRPMNLCAVGGQLVLSLSLSPSNGAPYVVWQSKDGGATWQSLPDPNGYPVAQIAGSSFGDGVTITYRDDSRIWIGTLNSR